MEHLDVKLSRTMCHNPDQVELDFSLIQDYEIKFVSLDSKRTKQSVEEWTKLFLLMARSKQKPIDRKTPVTPHETDNKEEQATRQMYLFDKLHTLDLTFVSLTFGQLLTFLEAIQEFRKRNDLLVNLHIHAPVLGEGTDIDIRDYLKPDIWSRIGGIRSLTLPYNLKTSFESSPPIPSPANLNLPLLELNFECPTPKQAKWAALPSEWRPFRRAGYTPGIATSSKYRVSELFRPIVGPYCVITTTCRKKIPGDGVSDYTGGKRKEEQKTKISKTGWEVVEYESCSEDEPMVWPKEDYKYVGIYPGNPVRTMLSMAQKMVMEEEKAKRRARGDPESEDEDDYWGM